VPLLLAAVSPAGPADACRICRKFGWLPKKVRRRGRTAHGWARLQGACLHLLPPSLHTPPPCAPAQETVIVQETVVAEPVVVEVVQVTTVKPKSPMEELFGRRDVRQGMSAAVAVATLALALEGTLWGNRK
jgi:hypothetical protein